MAHALLEHAQDWELPNLFGHLRTIDVCNNTHISLLSAAVASFRWNGAQEAMKGGVQVRACRVKAKDGLTHVLLEHAEHWQLPSCIFISLHATLAT